MDLAVVIVSYNTRQLTLDCLASVYRDLVASQLQAQVWVVDNASHDDSAEAIAAEYPQVHVYASTENLGFAGGVNRAMELLAAAVAAPAFILLLNPDTVVQPGALVTLLAFMRANDHAAVAGGQLLYADGSFQHSAFHFPTLWMIFFDFWTINHRLINSALNGRYPKQRYTAGQPFPVDHPLGAAMLVRSQAWQQVGALDAGYFMYCEEIDWCLRAKRLGWGIYCVPQAAITHYAGQSSRQFKAAMYIALWRSRYRLFERYYGACYRRLARLIVRLGTTRLIRRTQRAAARNKIDAAEAQHMVKAYQQVRELV